MPTGCVASWSRSTPPCSSPPAITASAWAEPSRPSPGGSTTLNIVHPDLCLARQRRLPPSPCISALLWLRMAVIRYPVTVNSEAPLSTLYSPVFSSLGGNGELTVAIEAMIGSRAVRGRLDLDEPFADRAPLFGGNAARNGHPAIGPNRSSAAHRPAFAGTYPQYRPDRSSPMGLDPHRSWLHHYPATGTPRWPLPSAGDDRGTASLSADADRSIPISATPGSLRPRRSTCWRWILRSPPRRALAMSAAAAIASGSGCAPWASTPSISMPTPWLAIFPAYHHRRRHLRLRRAPGSRRGHRQAARTGWKRAAIC